MAWEIVEASLRTTFSDIKKYIPVLISQVVISMLVFFAEIFELSTPTVRKTVFSMLEFVAVWIPCFAVIYGKNPIECFKKNPRAFIMLSAVFTAVTAVMSVVCHKVFPPHAATGFEPAEPICNLLLVVPAIVIKFAVIRIIKVGGGAFDAIFENSDNFSVCAGKNFWLYIRILLIDFLILIGIGLLTKIAGLIFGLIPVVGIILSALFSGAVSIVYSRIYCFIELSNYYETVCKPQNPYSK